MLVEILIETRYGSDVDWQRRLWLITYDDCWREHHEVPTNFR